MCFYLSATLYRCFVGKRNLEAAIKASGVKVEVQWRPYFLSLNTPPEGEDLMEHLESKYGKAAVTRFSAPGNPMDVAGEKVGIKFNKARRFVNTMEGHRLMEWCNNTHPDRSDSLMEALFHAYFEEGKDISMKEELLAVVTAAMGEEGGAEEEAGAVLASQQYRDEVRTHPLLL
jgi:predicted DsbA family dithiol-disulfide isomerase